MIWKNRGLFDPNRWPTVSFGDYELPSAQSVHLRSSDWWLRSIRRGQRDQSQTSGKRSFVRWNIPSCRLAEHAKLQNAQKHVGVIDSRLVEETLDSVCPKISKNYCMWHQVWVPSGDISICENTGKISMIQNVCWKDAFSLICFWFAHHYEAYQYEAQAHQLNKGEPKLKCSFLHQEVAALKALAIAWCQQWCLENLARPRAKPPLKAISRVGGPMEDGWRKREHGFACRTRWFLQNGRLPKELHGSRAAARPIGSLVGRSSCMIVTKGG